MAAAMSGRTSVLLYVLYPSHFKVMFRVAKLLVDSGHYAPIIYFDRDAPFVRDLEQACAAGILCLAPDGNEIAPTGEVAPPHRSVQLRIWQRGAKAAQVLPPEVRKAIAEVAVITLIAPHVWIEMNDLRRARRRYRNMLDRHDVRLVIGPGDNVGYGTPLLFQEVHRRGGKALIVPFTVSNKLEMAADLKRYREYSMKRLDNRLFGALYPRWVHEHLGNKMVRVSAARGIALELNGVRPPDPWVLNSGAADVLAVESRYMWDYYVRAGLPEDKFRLTGTLGDDAAARALADAPRRKKALLEELGLPTDRRCVLFSYGEYHYFFSTGRASEFADQNELTRFWLDSLTAMKDYNVLISLHPSLRREDMGRLESERVRIASRPIEDLIPLCDVYVVSISATTRTAIACGKPVVDHDVFHFDYDNFVGMDAVWIAQTREQFAGTLSRLAADEAFYQKACADQAKVAPRYAMMDGKVGERMLDLCDELSAAKP
jgi:hypothetical protein